MVFKYSAKVYSLINEGSFLPKCTLESSTINVQKKLLHPDENNITCKYRADHMVVFEFGWDDYVHSGTGIRWMSDYETEYAVTS